jgi:hypothetical protein
MWSQAKQLRMDEIAAELEQINTKNLSTDGLRRLERLCDEGEALRTEQRTHQAGLKYASYGSPAEYGFDGNPGDLDNNVSFKGFGPGMENRVQPTSMYAIDKTQINALKQASLQNTPLRIQIGSKGIEHGSWGDQIRTKAAVTESGMSPNLLPPVQQPGPMGYWGLPYELTRVANYLPNVGMDGPGIAYFQHTANAAESAYVAEGAAKPDISPTIKEQYIRPSKVAGRLLLTHELVQDAGDAFGNALIADLARSTYNAESNLLLNGTVVANGFAGINNVVGCLTRAAAIGTTDIDALDVLNKAFVDLRSDFFVPDLVIINPVTLGSIRRLRDANKRLQLELIEGPRRIDQTSETETLWGVQVVQTTQQAAGTAAVLSVASGAAVVYVRESMSVFFDPYSQASSNIYQYISEARLCLATPRVSATCLISGLPTT